MILISYAAHSLKRILQFQSCVLYIKHLWETYYLMSTEIKIWPGRQITTHQWYNCCCVLDPGSGKLSILLVGKALQFLMWVSSGIFISQCFHKSSDWGSRVLLALLRGRGNHFYSQLGGGKDLELLAKSTSVQDMVDPSWFCVSSGNPWHMAETRRWSPKNWLLPIPPFYWSL